MTETSTIPAALVLDGTYRSGSVLGGKGASLDQLVAWGLPVPATGAVTTAAYRSFATAPRIARLIESITAGEVRTEDEVDAVFGAEPFDPDTAAAVLGMAATVGDGSRLAVRSSATVEDLAGSSFAGQYRSILDVDPHDADAVLDAVRAVFASLWHPSPCAYRRALGVGSDDIAMAAVVMRMVPADRAGVVFTTDPGEPGSARVEVVDGLGEKLVSGDRTPDVFVVAHGSSGEDLPVEVREALTASLRIEDLSGYPNDVEWAWEGDRLWVVQARPITVSEPGDGFDSPITDDDLTTAGIAEMLPGVLPPLRWQLASHLVEQAFRRIFDALGDSGDGAASDAPLLRRVHGRAALDFGQLAAMTATFSPDATSELEARYFGTDTMGPPPGPAAPSGRGRLGAVVAQIRRGRRVGVARRRFVLDADIVVEAVARSFESPDDWSDRPDDVLLAHRLELVDLADRAATAQMGVAAEASSAFDRVVALLTPHFGAEAATGFARSVTSGAGILARQSSDASAAVFAGPTWADLDRQPIQPVARDGDAEIAALETALAETPTWPGDGVRNMLRRRALNHAIDDAVTQLRRRESTKAALMRLGGAVRGIHRELGGRLEAAGRLDRAEDVELLSDAELHASLRGKPPTTAVLRRRRRWLDRAEGEPPLPTRFSGEPQTVEGGGGDRIAGWAASPGTYRGTAVAMADASAPFPDGAVLVAAATDASWAPLFTRAGAVVVERGGPLSHASILARELGVPAVVNAADAMTTLGGRVVLVNGDLGTVEIDLDEEPSS